MPTIPAGETRVSAPGAVPTVKLFDTAHGPAPAALRPFTLKYHVPSARSVAGVSEHSPEPDGHPASPAVYQRETAVTAQVNNLREDLVANHNHDGTAGAQVDHKDLVEKFIQADATMGHDAPRRFEGMALELESLVSQLERTLH